MYKKYNVYKIDFYCTKKKAERRKPYWILLGGGAGVYKVLGKRIGSFFLANAHVYRGQKNVFFFLPFISSSS